MFLNNYLSSDKECEQNRIAPYKLFCIWFPSFPSMCLLVTPHTKVWFVNWQHQHQFVRKADFLVPLQTYWISISILRWSSCDQHIHTLKSEKLSRYHQESLGSIVSFTYYLLQAILIVILQGLLGKQAISHSHQFTWGFGGKSSKLSKHFCLSILKWIILDEFHLRIIKAKQSIFTHFQLL